MTSSLCSSTVASPVNLLRVRRLCAEPVRLHGLTLEWVKSYHRYTDSQRQHRPFVNNLLQDICMAKVLRRMRFQRSIHILHGVRKCPSLFLISATSRPDNHFFHTVPWHQQPIYTVKVSNATWLRNAIKPSFSMKVSIKGDSHTWKSPFSHNAGISLHSNENSVFSESVLFLSFGYF